MLRSIATALFLHVHNNFYGYYELRNALEEKKIIHIKLFNGYI